MFIVALAALFDIPVETIGAAVDFAVQKIASAGPGNVVCRF